MVCGYTAAIKKKLEKRMCVF